jgi:hypothetical protein
VPAKEITGNSLGLASTCCSAKRDSRNSPPDNRLQKSPVRLSRTTGLEAATRLVFLVAAAFSSVARRDGLDAEE